MFNYCRHKHNAANLITLCKVRNDFSSHLDQKILQIIANETCLHKILQGMLSTKIRDIKYRTLNKPGRLEEWIDVTKGRKNQNVWAE
jgi:hypothetical protein